MLGEGDPFARDTYLFESNNMFDFSSSGEEQETTFSAALSILLYGEIIPIDKEKVAIQCELWNRAKEAREQARIVEEGLFIRLDSSPSVNGISNAMAGVDLFDDESLPGDWRMGCCSEPPMETNTMIKLHWDDSSELGRDNWDTSSNSDLLQMEDSTGGKLFLSSMTYSPTPRAPPATPTEIKEEGIFLRSELPESLQIDDWVIA